jgi:hypothetical protein
MRNALLLSVLERYGVGQVLSHWPYLPPLIKQLASSGSSRPWACATMNPISKPNPFDKIVEVMLQPEMILDRAYQTS